MKNRLDALEDDHLFDELNYGTGAFPEDEIEGSEQDWQSEKASESEEIESDADSVKKPENGAQKTKEKDEVDDFWNSQENKKGALLRDPRLGVGKNKNDNKRKTRGQQQQEQIQVKTQSKTIKKDSKISKKTKIQ